MTPAKQNEAIARRYAEEESNQGTLDFIAELFASITLPATTVAVGLAPIQGSNGSGDITEDHAHGQ